MYQTLAGTGYPLSFYFQYMMLHYFISCHMLLLKISRGNPKIIEFKKLMKINHIMQNDQESLRNTKKKGCVNTEG